MCASNSIIHHSLPPESRPKPRSNGHLVLLQPANPCCQPSRPWTAQSDEDLTPPWPATLHLPHLRRLRTDPRHSAPFLSFLLSHCSNIEHFTIDTVMRPPNLWRPTVALPKDIDLHRLPNLRTLDVIGNYHALQWCNERINLAPSDKLLKVSTSFRPGDQLSDLVDTWSSCRLDITVESSFNDPLSRCVLNRPLHCNF